MVGVGRSLDLERREGEGRFGVEESFHRIGLDWIVSFSDEDDGTV